MVQQAGAGFAPARRGSRHEFLPLGRAVALTDELSGRLTALAGLDLDDLRSEWQRLYRSTPPIRVSRDLLQRSIAHRMQEVALGGLSPAIQRQLAAFARSLAINGKLPP